MVKFKQILALRSVTGRFVNKMLLFIALTSLGPGWQLSYTLSATCEQAVAQLALLSSCQDIREPARSRVLSLSALR